MQNNKKILKCPNKNALKMAFHDMNQALFAVQGEFLGF